MRMKKLILLSVLFGVCSINMMAQDDVYFTPKKSEKTVKKNTNTAKDNADDKPVYHSGSTRETDEYNHRGKFGSHYEVIGTDSLGNDIIEFHTSKEDSIAALVEYDKHYDVDEDYRYSHWMSRFDDFYWYNPYFFGPYYSWHSPWWYSYWGWYDPWYYRYNGWYGWYDWYDPFYYSYYGWGFYPYRWGWYTPTVIYTNRPAYTASGSRYHPGPGGSRSTTLYNRNNGRPYAGSARYGSGSSGSGVTYRGDYSSSGNYSSSNVNRGYQRSSSGSYSSSGTSSGPRPVSSGSSTRSSGSYSSGSSGGSYRSSGGGGGGYSGSSSSSRSSGGGGGGGVSHGGRR